MYRLRRWSANHAYGLEKLYALFERILIRVYSKIKFPHSERLEPAVTAVERQVKQLFFDSQMCGSCTLGSTGMTCPMNCPKTMRNGPCGGVRPNGRCEIKPNMQCVWLDAYNGSLQIDKGARILEIQLPLDHRLANTSSWLHELRKKARSSKLASDD